MTGSTHVAVGIATSLLVLRPATVPECLSTVAGGMIGASISDVDHQAGKTTEFEAKDIVRIILWTLVILGVDYISGGGINDYIAAFFGPIIWGGAAVFAIAIIRNAKKVHQGFLHSILGGIILMASIYLFCRPATFSFGIGYFSHIFLDCLNGGDGPQLFYPFSKHGCALNKCSFKGPENNILGAIGTIISVYFGSYLFINAMVSSNLYDKMLGLFAGSIYIKEKAIPIYVIYFGGINIITLLANIINEKRNSNRDSENEDIGKDELIIVVLSSLDILGGAIGKLIAVLVTNGFIYKKNNWRRIVDLCVTPLLCIIICWISLFVTFFFKGFISR